MVILAVAKMLDNCLTSSIKSKAGKQNLAHITMSEEYVTVREFLRNYKKFTNKKKPVIVTNNGKPEGVFISYERWEKKEKRESEERFISLADAIKPYISTGSGEKDLSQRVDEIVYGAANPNRNDND